MRGRFGRWLIAAGVLTLVAAPAMAPPSYAGEIRTFADDFSNQSYASNDGTHEFNSAWSEAPIHNGSNRGNIQIDNSGPGCNRCLVIGDPLAIVDSSIGRSADLDGASSARLDLRYRTDGKPGETAAVRLSVHNGSESQTLWTFSLDEDDEHDEMLAASFDITGFAGPDTTIRFTIVGAGVTDAELRIADVTITATFGTTPTTSTPTTAPTTTTTTSTTTTSTTTTTTPRPTSTTSTTTTSTTSTPIGPTSTTSPPADTTTTTRSDVTTTTVVPADDPADSSTTTTTVIVPPTEDPDYATDKVVLLSDNETAAMAVMQPMGAMMRPENQPDTIGGVRFVNAAESLRSTAVYGVGVGVLLAGFLLVGFDDEEARMERRRIRTRRN